MNENYRLSDLFLNVEEEERETWKIDNDNTADWAIDNIKESKEEYERFEKVALRKIEQIKEALDQEKKKMENETSFFESKLREYIETVKMKETKTQKTYALPAGKIIIKKDKCNFRIDKDAILENIKMLEGYEDYIKVKEDLAWGDLKKKLVIDNGNIINKITGEVLKVKGLEVEVKPGKFEVKF
ncbi:host-nuclease inhibitor Gam family protein [Tepidibacter mesophilus]|uniref:host-nuclease inhibitor Gam family protein n=1 Tax=Tepidibacter mesophilus TaxID=655607 RepID=UPI0016515A04|nr:host-nuclease inhibitor Gam family protein [Tepidibacter mesophilus]